ncbi:hypothetical protein AM571_CH03293 [Rhizobium etli 8C-3]|uniref:Uncharacterized protein n=1 Tax=Rhizobium etli 8C-3 TaxID=538025 RepID=A0A1L5P7B5_RHIET|nr:hypothetical protein [Rhizobium etli]APO76087.1 hypothetical protein AM571_CH03293 [Rhizobium etli 8C-3]
MNEALPLFETSELKQLRSECEDLVKKLQRGGRDARSRIRMEQKLALARAKQIKLELQLGLGRRS